MKGKLILLVAAGLLAAAGLVQAQEAELSGELELTYLSSYIWRGFDMYPGSHGEGAIQPSVDLDLFGTGLGLEVLWSRANEGGHENAEWLTYSLYYRNTAMEDEVCQMDYKVGWGHYVFPDMPRDYANMQEAYAELSWPSVLEGGVVPRYKLICMWPSSSGSDINRSVDVSGWMHMFGFSWNIPVDLGTSDIPQQDVVFTADVVYNDGAFANVGEVLTGKTIRQVDHDWSHMVFGLSTDFDLGNDTTFTPGVYHQVSMDDSVNDSEETWASASLKYSF